MGARFLSKSFCAMWMVAIPLITGCTKGGFSSQPGSKISSSLSLETGQIPLRIEAQSTANWQNFAVPLVSTSFAVDYDAIPNVAKMNGLVALSSGVMTSAANAAVLVRFNSAGNIDANNGALFQAVAAMPYQAGVKYHFHIDVNPVAKTYSLFVTPNGGQPQVVASGYAFQSRVASLNDFSLQASSGSASISKVFLSIAINTNSSPAPSPTPLPSPSPTAVQITMGEKSLLTDGDSGNGNLLLAQSASLAQDSTLQSLSFFVTNAVGQLYLGVYDASGANGGPGHLLAQTSVFTPIAGWNTAQVTKAVALKGGSYWLAYLPSDNNLAFLKGLSSGSKNAVASYAFGPMPESFAANVFGDGYHWSFYATLNAFASSLPNPNPTPAPNPNPVPSPSPAPGSGPNPSPVPTPTPTPQPAGLPTGVTLQQIDGGANYYCSHGFTQACNAGWDQPTFFPIGTFYGMFVNDSDGARWNDLGLNVSVAVTANSNMQILRDHNIQAVINPTENPGFGNETVGLNAFDEPESMSQWEATIQRTSNSVQDTRFWMENNTWNFFAYGGISPVNSSNEVLATQVSSPGGRKRSIDIPSVDIYWFAGAAADGDYQCGLIFNTTCTKDMVKRGSNYGLMVDRMRAFESVSEPIMNFVEDGGPYTQDNTAATYITPEQLNWSAWSNVIHGARMLIYFNHTFGVGSPAQSNDNLAYPYYQAIQPGQSISMYNQVKATDHLIAQLAPVINSPTAVSYVSVTPAATSPFSGIETMSKYYNGQFYIFADTRMSQTAANIAATFTVADKTATSVTVLNEGRTLPVMNGVFHDTFAKGSTVHIYQVK